MKVQFVRTGGFAGMRLAATIDSSTLPADEAQALKTELETANFFSLPAQLTSPAGGADRFQYEITVEDGGKKHTIETGETSMPETLQPFVQHVELLARSSRR
jgi:hypothetical protein